MSYEWLNKNFGAVALVLIGLVAFGMGVVPQEGQPFSVPGALIDGLVSAVVAVGVLGGGFKVCQIVHRRYQERVHQRT